MKLMQRRRIGAGMAGVMLLAQIGPLMAQQKTQPGTPATATAAPAKPTAAAPQTAAPKAASGVKPVAADAKDVGWPRVYSDGRATITVHQPQIDSWKDFQTLEARMAVEVQTDKSAKKQIAAVVWKAQTLTDVGQRTVQMGDIEIVRFSIPGLDEAKTKELQALTVSLLPRQKDALSLDRILAHLDKGAVQVKAVKISTEPPPIMVSTRPAILVMIDGQPILGPVPETKLTFVVNTNWDLVKDDDEFFLLNGTQWLTAKALEGPWKSASKVPKELNSVPADENWKDVKKALPLSKENKSMPAPWVYVANKPSELILLDGEPKLAPINGTQLSEVTNTKSLLFFHAGTKQYYYLAAGRWFKNPTLRGNWEYTSDSLPADFRDIPKGHPKAFVLASVPGTPEAQDAVLLASVPQTAVIDRKKAASEAKVTYVGQPEFKPITGTNMQYAANTPSDVIQLQDKYYLCQEGVWFIGSSANGPWEVADTVPQEIYSIPPDSPKHNTTYVYVQSSDSQTVTTAQTAGYMGLAIGIGIGVACWGTGYYYPPYYYYGPMYPYPVYWGYPYAAYGAAAWYNPATGFYGRGAVAYGPYGGYGRAAAYNPVTGTYARRAGAYGPYQAGVATSFYNPRTGSYGAGYRYANPYQGWGEGVVGKGDKWAKGGYYYDDRGAIGGIKTSEGGRLIAAGDGDNRGGIARTSDGDLYVGKNGEIYKRDDSGNWQHRGDGGGWNDVNYDSLTPDQKQRVDNAKQQRGQASQAASNRAQGTNRAQPGTMDRAQPGTLDRSQVGNRAQPGTLDRAQPGAVDRSGAGRAQPGTMDRPQPGTARSATGSVGEMRPSTTNRDVMGGLDRDAGARSMGNQRAHEWNRGGGSGGRGSFGGGGRMGGGRMGGRRR